MRRRARAKEHSVGKVESGRYLPWKAHRLRGLVTLEEIAEVTKISKRFLEAIENGMWGQLPGGVFTTSYIRQYAAMIGFESGEILRQEKGGGTVGEEIGPVEAPKWGKAWIQGVVEKG